jgi:hypothetical protein
VQVAEIVKARHALLVRLQSLYVVAFRLRQPAQEVQNNPSAIFQFCRQDQAILIVRLCERKIALMVGDAAEIAEGRHFAAPIAELFAETVGLLKIDLRLCKITLIECGIAKTEIRLSRYSGSWSILLGIRGARSPNLSS